MENKDLQHTQQNSLQMTQTTNECNDIIIKSVVKCCKRLEQDLGMDSIKLIAEDIQSTFPRATEEDLLQAIKDGGTGRFGITYKLSSQVICHWIREYLKSKPQLNRPDPDWKENVWRRYGDVPKKEQVYTPPPGGFSNSNDSGDINYEAYKKRMEREAEQRKQKPGNIGQLIKESLMK